MKNIDLLGGTEILSEDECWELLRSQTVGRVVVAMNSELDVFPVNYGLDGEGIIFRTNAGRKLTWSLGRPVAFEIDRIDVPSRTGWSVVAHGEARDITRFDAGERQVAAHPWTGAKDFLIRITPRSVTGRRVAAQGT